MLFATSCQNDLDFGTSAEKTSVVSFSVGTPEIATRAFSDGTTATKLQYAVYDAEGNELEYLTKTDGEIHGTATVNLQLTTGNTYSIIFWAAAENAPYTVNFADKTMSVDYASAVSNDETRDAFYKHHTFTVTGTQTETIELKRPFAQLNIGTADYEISEQAGYVPTKSSVTVRNIYSTLNLATGAVSDEVEAVYASADIKRNENFPVAGYEYLAMNYLLVAADKALVDIDFTYTDGSNAKTRTVGSVPVQRNYRTNIYGNILTSEVGFNVDINPEYEDDYNNEHLYYVEEENTFYITSVEGFNLFAEKVNSGNTEWSSANISLEGDVDLAAVATRSAASNWTSIGTEAYPFTGAFDGKGYTIKNLNIVETEAKEGKAFIGFFGYAKNASIKNVTFENVYINVPCLDIDHSQGHIAAIAGSLEGTSTVENVTVKGDIKIESSLENNGASRVAVVAGGGHYQGNVTMKNVHVIANEGSYLKANNNVGALAGQLQGTCIFENCSSNIDVTGYKFFAGGIIGLSAGNSKFTNCRTTGNVTILAGRSGRDNDQYRVGGIAGGWADNTATPCVLTNCSYTGEVSGTNADGSVAKPLDYLGYVGRGYTLTNKAGSTVIIDGISFVQKYNDQFGIYDVSNAEGETIDVLLASKEDLPLVEGTETLNTVFDENVTLFGDITVSSNETNANSGYKGGTGFSVLGSILDGQGNTLTVTNAGTNWGSTIYTTGGTIKNLTVAGAIRGIFMGKAICDLHIDNVTFKCLYTFNSDGGSKDYGVYISNSQMNGWTSFSNAHKEVVFTNCTFAKGSGYAFVRPYNPCVFENCEFSTDMEFDVSQQSNIVFRNCTYGGVKITAENATSLKTGDKTFFFNGLGGTTFE